jgi:hypothetical protein
MKLEDPNLMGLSGASSRTAVTVVNVQWFGSEALELTYKDPEAESLTSCFTATTSSAKSSNKVGLGLRRDEVFAAGSEAHRIRLAYLFDPVLAVHTSLVDRYPTRSPLFMMPCCPTALRFYWLTTRAPVKLLWRVLYQGTNCPR